MAGFSDTVRIVIDVVTDKAGSAIGDLKGKVADAEGSFGKLKAAGGGAFDALKTAAPLALAGVGTALAGFALKGVSDFEQLGVAAGNFSDAAGISTQDASRWIEVSGDLGVSTDAVQASMQRLNREAATGALAKFGITAQDSNTRLIQTVQYLQSIPDEAKRAQVQFQLLGKGGAALEPLIASAGELDGRLKSVSGNKIISPQEAQNAKNLRDAMDNVSDAVDNLELALGEGLAPVIEKVTKLAVGDGSGGLLGALGKLGDLKDSLPGGSTLFDEVVGDLNPVQKAIDLFGQVQDAIGGTAAATDKAATSTKGLSDNSQILNQHYQNRISGTQQATASTDNDAAALAAAKASLDLYTQSTKDGQKAVDDLTRALIGEYDSLASNTTSMLAAQSQQIATNASLQAYGKTLGDTTLTADQHTTALNDVETQLINTATATANAQTATMTFGSETEAAGVKAGIQKQYLESVAGTLAPGSPLRVAIEAYIAKLDSIKSNIDTQINLDTSVAQAEMTAWLNQPRTITVGVDTVSTDPLHSVTSGPRRAGGGPVTAGRPYIVGEDRPELFVPDQSGMILPSVPTAGSHVPMPGGAAAPAMTFIVNNPRGTAAEWSRALFAEATWELRKAG